MSKSKGRLLAEWLRNLNVSSKATTNTIADDAITNAKIADDAVDNAQIADDAVHTANLADANVTFAKLHTALVVTESDTIGSNDNDTTVPTSAAVIDYIGTYVAGNQTYGNITTTGYIAGPATFTIDPAAVGDNTGTLVVAGNLQVDGTTTTINSTTMTVDDLNITLASGAANAAAANGAGVTVEGASATLTYNSTPDAWSFNKNLGIGVTNPDARLSVTTDQQLIARLASSNTGITGVRLQGLDASANDAVFVDWFYDAEHRQYGFGEGTASGSLPINSGIAQADVVINNGNVRITSENGLSALSVTTNPLTLGSLTSYNMALDSNEIQARNICCY